jgi:GntR family transcriptional repressor for pyruvate dehydrogenase complex
MVIVDQLRHLINIGELQVGDKLPPEQVLAQKFGVARPTVREALS